MRDHREGDGEEKCAALEDHVRNGRNRTIPDRSVAANDQRHCDREKSDGHHMRPEVAYRASGR